MVDAAPAAGPKLGEKGFLSKIWDMVTGAPAAAANAGANLAVKAVTENDGLTGRASQAIIGRRAQEEAILNEISGGAPATPPPAAPPKP